MTAVPLPGRTSVAVAFMVAVGSRHESASNSGISHFVEHMVFKGGRRYPTARDVSIAVESVGGVLNAATDREATVFWTRVPADKLQVAVSVLTDMLLQPALDSAEVVKERQVVIEELRMYQDNPQDYVQILFDEVMWPDHPLGWDVAGREETVRGFAAEDCRDHLAAHLTPGNLVVSIAGGFETPVAAEMIDGAINSWAVAPREQPAPAIPATAPTGSPLRVIRRSAEQANILVGARAPSYNDPERHVADILNVILGEGMSSRLFLELREHRGLVYDVHSFMTRLSDSGVLGIGLACEPKHAATALEAAIAELRKLAEAPVGDAELTKAIEYTKGRLLLGLESTSALCEYGGQQLLLQGHILEPEELVERIESVDAAQVRALAARLLESGLRAAVVGPFRSETRFEKAIA
ncbi:MAG: pitrilysin family protein [Candidatus Dormiibacterota bacterium]